MDGCRSRDANPIRSVGWPADVAELLDRGATVVVLSLGIDRQLQVMPETLRYLQERSIEVHVLETREAMTVYNTLAETVAVGGLFHSTC